MITSNELDGWITPDWPAPARVHAVATCRSGPAAPGEPAFAGFNLGGADQAWRILQHRERLRTQLQLTEPPFWPCQVHGTTVLRLPLEASTVSIEADAVWTTTPGVVCAVQTADCLPILLCDTAGSCVAALHAGWRGLAAGIVEASGLLAWLGPAIGPTAFEVGEEVRAAFMADDTSAEAAFLPLPIAGKYLADLYALARLRLRRFGLQHITGGDRCTFCEADRYYSFRRDGVTGRQASLIWLDSP
jgi:YfiH family protein